MSDHNPPTTQSQIAELKVSGHTMALDPGLYCVFSAPGSVAPAADTGLPTVRISAAPGAATGRVEVVGLHPGGYIGPDSATLVRVAEARSAVLVTVYQAKNTRAEAPQIQVVRISGDTQVVPPAAAAAMTGDAAVTGEAAVGLLAPARTPREVHVVAHIYGRGDVGGEIGAWMGEPGSKRWIEGFAVAPAGEVPAADVEYQAVLGRGWLSPWSEGGQFCGSRSMALPILGLRVRLRGASAGTHRVVLSATFVDGSKVGPVGDGEPCEAASLAALEAFHLQFEPIGAATAAAKAGGRQGWAKVAPAAEAPAVAQPAAAKGRAAKAAATRAEVTQAEATRAEAMQAKVPQAKGTSVGAVKPAAAKTRATGKPLVEEKPVASSPARGRRAPEPEAAPVVKAQSVRAQGKVQVGKIQVGKAQAGKGGRTGRAAAPEPAAVRPAAVPPAAAKPRAARKPAPTRRR